MACENVKNDRGEKVWGRKNASGKETQTEYKTRSLYNIISLPKREEIP